LVERPIEVVEYQRLALSVTVVDRHTAAWPQTIVPGQDLGEFTSPTRARANGHLSYEKQQELMPELGDIDIGVGTLQATNARMAMVVEDSIEQLREWVKQQSSCTCRRIALASAGSERVAVVTTGQEFCLFHAGDTVRPELTEQLERI